MLVCDDDKIKKTLHINSPTHFQPGISDLSVVETILFLDLAGIFCPTYLNIRKTISRQ